MPLVITVLLLCSLVCFLLAAYGAVVKPNLVALGLALWMFTLLLARL